MCGIPNRFKFQVVGAVLVHLRVYANLHDPINKHGHFDRGDSQILDSPSLMINILGGGQTDIFEYFALS